MRSLISMVGTSGVIGHSLLFDVTKGVQDLPEIKYSCAITLPMSWYVNPPAKVHKIDLIPSLALMLEDKSFPPVVHAVDPGLQSLMARQRTLNVRSRVKIYVQLRIQRE